MLPRLLLTPLQCEEIRRLNRTDQGKGKRHIVSGYGLFGRYARVEGSGYYFDLAVQIFYLLFQHYDAVFIGDLTRRHWFIWSGFGTAIF